MQFIDARKYKKEIKSLYKNAFPASERPPLWLLLRKTKDKRNSFYAVVDDGIFVGLVYTITSEEMVYVFFLAVAKELRSKGYGTKILDYIKENNKNKTITLEIEDTNKKNAENYEQRINRLKFYERNGFSKLSIYVNEAGVDFELLGTRASVSKSDFLSLMKNYLGSFLFKIIFKNKSNLE